MIALFASLGGISYGLAGKNTVDSRDIINQAVKSNDIKNSGVKSKDLRTGSVKSVDVLNDSIVGADVNEATLGEVPTANDADNLGGEAAANYLRSNACQTGSVLGFAEFNGAALTPDFSTTGVSITRNCSGGTVEGRRTGEGQYEVRFNGNPAALAVASPQSMGTCQSTQIDGISPGTFEVRMTAGCGTEGIIDGVFTVVLP